MATPVSTKPGWRFGVFEVDARKGELRRSGVPLKLREQSFQILLALLESPGVIVSREELRHLLWPSDTFVDFDHSLNTAMMKLRDALGDSAEAPIYIETIPKRGYRFVAPMTTIADIRDEVVVVDAKPVSTQAGSIVSPSAEQAGPSRGSVHRHQIRTIVTGLGIALAVLAGTLVFLRVHPNSLSSRAVKDAASYRIDSVTTSRGLVKSPEITPDGRDVAYAWNGGGGDHFDIYVQRIGSPKPMRITYTNTAFAGYPAWSPDLKEIAFTRCDGKQAGVYIVPALGGTERKLTTINCQYNAPTPVFWLPGSRLIMIDLCPASGLHGLVLFSLDTGEKRCIADIGQGGVNRRFEYAISPDQTTAAFIPSIELPDCCEIYTIPVSGGSVRRIVHDSGSCDEVMWTPDGKEIVFLSERTTFPSMWQVPANGGNLRQSSYPAVGSFSEDGRRFVYTEESNGEPHTIWRADLASPGGNVLVNKKLIATQFSEMDAQPSPDGTRIVWMERLAGGELWTSSTTGENPLQLTHLNSYSGTPRWSPDGKWIAFDKSTPAGAQIFVIDAEGRNLRQITRGRYLNIVPSWSHDGKSIYFSSMRSGNKEVWKHSLDTGEEIQLTTHGGFNPIESFDGRTIYFARFDQAGIWSIPSVGGNETVILEGSPQLLCWGLWALTRPGIYFLNADAEPRASIEFYDFTSRRSSPVLSIEKNAPWGQPSLSATSDGKTIFYSQFDPQSVIKMMEFQW